MKVLHLHKPEDLRELERELRKFAKQLCCPECQHPHHTSLGSEQPPCHCGCDVDRAA